jgi:DNA-binding CsgD family transcriptional regulator
MNIYSHRGLPLARLLDYLEEVVSSTSKDDLMRRAMYGFHRIVDFDVGVGFFDLEQRCLAGIGPDEDVIRTYNEHYRFRSPSLVFDEGGNFVGGPDRVDWREFRDTEFYCDFLHPNGIAYGMHLACPDFKLSLIVQRSASSRGFSEVDCRSLEVANRYINNLAAIFDRFAQGAGAEVSVDEISDHFPCLSRRETEIACLLCHGLTALGIATRLFISPRTVEVHVTHIYEKLDVHSRREALALLTGGMGRASGRTRIAIREWMPLDLYPEGHGR